ncbi:MAG: heavy metal translocating P-type ATPase [Candidatus Ranarchaeia archaeon]|jgi:Cd2+/Zn2+-exporting ATPase
MTSIETCTVCAPDTSGDKSQKNHKDLIIISTSISLLIAAFLLELVFFLDIYAFWLFLITAGISGYEIIIKGLTALFRRRKISVNLLMTISAVGAFLIGHGEEGAVLLFLYYIAIYLEKLAFERTNRSVKDLIEMTPEQATVKIGEEEIVKSTQSITKGEILIVRPGDRIPLDGVVRAGDAGINQAPITGESSLVHKTKNDMVFAGTLNETGFLEIEVTKESTETLLSKIVELVETAKQQKTETERYMDRFAKYYVPFVVLVAVFIGVGIPILLNQSLYIWVYRALTLLTISCPCALVISTPVTILAGITGAAKNGVLIKSGIPVEEMRGIKVFAFDKTGTITKGTPVVKEILPLSEEKDISKETLLKYAAISEYFSKHPQSKAILKQAETSSLVIEKPTTYQYVAGQGNIVTYKGDTILSGNIKLLQNHNVPVSSDIVKKVAAFSQAGKTSILVTLNSQIMGIITTSDAVRAASKEMMADLHRQEITTVLISGDNQATVKAIADEVGIERYYANLSPEEKLQILETLKTEIGKTAMVGDGINDAPALARADISIAMGVMGSEAAIETADIALMQDDLTKIPYLINLSKRIVDLFQRNIVFTLSVKGILTVLTILGLVTLWMAVGIGDMGLSLAVILFSSQVYRHQISRKPRRENENSPKV